MTLEWKLRQALSHRLFPIEDELKADEVERVDDRDQWLELCTAYFNSSQGKLYYPCKSYCVGIIYAQLLSENFGIAFKEALDDPGLLFHNDPCFVPYSADPTVYDAILERISLHFDAGLPQVAKTMEFFRREFLIGEEYEHWLPRL